MARVRFSARVRMTHQEYRANLNGLNIFFGAVLGFVLAGTETLDPLRFSILLLGTAAVVITILYINASANRLTYSVLGLVLIIAMPRWITPWMPSGFDLPANLQPTLIVWAAMTAIIEFLPREGELDPVKEPSPGAQEQS